MQQYLVWQWPVATGCVGSICRVATPALPVWQTQCSLRDNIFFATFQIFLVGFYIFQIIKYVSISRTYPAQSKGWYVPFSDFHSAYAFFGGDKAGCHNLQTVAELNIFPSIANQYKSKFTSAGSPALALTALR